MHPPRVCAVILPLIFGLSAAAVAQGRAQRIQAKDGDLIVIGGTDTVRIVRGRDVNVRALYNGQLKRLVLLIDHMLPAGSADGRVDEIRNFEGLSPDWPFGDRWEGRATLQEYWLVAPDMMPRTGTALSTPMGVVQLGSPERGVFGDTSAVVALTYQGAGNTQPPRSLSFDEAEQEVLAGRLIQPSSSSVTLVAEPPVMASPQPVRVGGNIPKPTQIQYVRPVYPEDAMKARITGVVVIEAIIGVDGTVTGAHVLRGVPMLDQAALDAVRQWRFEPTLLNGVPVPVIMTVTVNFDLK